MSENAETGPGAVADGSAGDAARQRLFPVGDLERRNRRRASGWQAVLTATGVAVFALGGLFGLVVAEVYVSAWAMTGLAACYALLLVFGLLAPAGTEAGCQTGFAALLLAFVSWLAGASAADQLPLALHGRTADARVVSVEHTVVDRSQRWQATLLRSDGTPVPGPRLLDSSERLHPGDTVHVVYDPGGTVAPRRPADIHPARDAAWSIAIAAGLLAVIAWAGLRGHRRRSKP
ncbi:hypothetical protein [Kitasatospora acidiphila]|uniref:hypothetical protein n=1 Tax=Kitasatospora acidiphila TaxID=2567942 RepID=UPI003C77F873